MSLKTVAGVVGDVSFSNPTQQDIFTHLSDAFGRRPRESLRTAAERVIACGYRPDEPVDKAARVVLELDARRAVVEPTARTRVAWEGLAEARRLLMEPSE